MQNEEQFIVLDTYMFSLYAEIYHPKVKEEVLEKGWVNDGSTKIVRSIKSHSK